MKIYFITSNKGKFEWAKRRLINSGINLIRKDFLIEESRAFDVEDVVKHKASKIGVMASPFLVEDSGFYIPALNGFPATQIKFSIKTLGIKNFLKLMEDKKNRVANFKSALCFVYEGRQQVFVCNDFGKLSEKMHGSNLHGFNELLKIFIPSGFNKTLAQMTDDEFKQYERGIEKIDHYCQFSHWFTTYNKL